MAESQGRLSFKGRPLSVRGLAKGQSQRPSTCRRALEPADDPRARMIEKAESSSDQGDQAETDF